jgi:hypothetical protein
LPGIGSPPSANDLTHLPIPEILKSKNALAVKTCYEIDARLASEERNVKRKG